MSFRGFQNLTIIDRSMITLFCGLTLRRVRAFSNTAAIGELHRAPWTDPAVETRNCARTILGYFGIKNSAVKVTFDPRLTVPGRVYIGHSDVFFVDISEKFKCQRNAVIAILAHEVAHIFLHKHHIKFETTLENEILTDTVAAFLGFGPSILNVAYSRATRNGNTLINSSLILGYLSVDEFGYVIAKRRHYFGNASPLQLEPGLPSEGYESGKSLVESIRTQRPFIERGLLDRACWWIKSLFASNATNSDAPIVFNCQYCSQKLRIPSNGKTLQVKCSTCGSTQLCYS